VIWSVSVDLDGLGCYAAIHGLPQALDDRALRAVPEVALARFCELFAELRVPATFFAIGREVPIAPAALRAASQAHEIGSHSHAHDYALSRLPPAAIAADLAACEEALAAAGIARPRGFRAPGYTLSAALIEAVRERGYLYDSSLLPSPPYYAAKAAALAWYAVRGRRSHSILGAPGQLFSRRGPHLRRGLRELPVATAPGLRIPVIGTVVLAAPWTARLGWAGRHLNLELHGIDLLDASDVPPAIAAAQPGLRTSAARKAQALRQILRALPGEARTLEDAARLLVPA
jgi:peptidoglycan-N-acetylglucosamine deacetylase